MLSFYLDLVLLSKSSQLSLEAILLYDKLYDFEPMFCMIHR